MNRQRSILQPLEMAEANDQNVGQTSRFCLIAFLVIKKGAQMNGARNNVM